MPTSAEEEVTLSLSKKEALVLFEFVSRFSDGKLNIEDQAEEWVLWGICELLEKRLVEPLRADYAEVLAEARKTIRDEKA